jgi:hypothetical protein
MRTQPIPGTGRSRKKLQGKAVSNNTLERTAGSHSLAAAAQRGRYAE